MPEDVPPEPEPKIEQPLPQRTQKRDSGEWDGKYRVHSREFARTGEKPFAVDDVVGLQTELIKVGIPAKVDGVWLVRGDSKPFTASDLVEIRRILGK